MWFSSVKSKGYKCRLFEIVDFLSCVYVTHCMFALSVHLWCIMWHSINKKYWLNKVRTYFPGVFSVLRVKSMFLHLLGLMPLCQRLTFWAYWQNLWDECISRVECKFLAYWQEGVMCGVPVFLFSYMFLLSPVHS